MSRYNHIELFAGCGGLSLGLGATGFDLVMANEVSPMAGETFAFNLLGEDLDALGQARKKAGKVLWLRSQYPQDNLTKRRREDPSKAALGSYTDIAPGTLLRGKLLIGDIGELLRLLKNNRALLNQLRGYKVDLVSGGPPCQGFSLAGKRLHADHKNLLPLSFAECVGLLKPKLALLENVRGIVAPFTVGKIKHHSWIEAAKAFALQGYAPVCMLANSACFGVPQYRVRFIMLAVRHDMAKQLRRKWVAESPIHGQILTDSLKFYSKVRRRKQDLGSIGPEDLPLYDSDANPELFDGKLLPALLPLETGLVTARKALDDIRRTSISYRLDERKSDYAQWLDELLPRNGWVPHEFLLNHEARLHSYPVMARFRLYQVINSFNGNRDYAMRLANGLSVPPTIKSEVLSSLKRYTLLLNTRSGLKLRKLRSGKEVSRYLASIRTHKHSQRALVADEPAPAQLTIPDDQCHYSAHHLRTLTVREVARLQSFPDWFSFRSKTTTGGSLRSFEIPQYTQVGNAVPPLMAYAIGQAMRSILEVLSKSDMKDINEPTPSVQPEPLLA